MNPIPTPVLKTVFLWEDDNNDSNIVEKIEQWRRANPNTLTVQQTIIYQGSPMSRTVCYITYYLED